MIQIGNQFPSEGANIAESPVQNTILTQMRQSQTVYRYEQAGQLQFELRLRELITANSVQLYRSGVSYATFEQSRCNPAFWELTPRGGFLLKPGVLPSDAIQDIYRNGAMYAFECATAMVIVLYKAVLDVLGPPVFNRLFESILLWAWQYDKDLGLHTARRPDVLPGDIVYFKNPDVDPATPEWQGENAIVMPDGTYYGHGIGITSAQAIISALNANRRPGAQRPAYLTDQVTRPNYRYLYSFSGAPRMGVGKIGTVTRRWSYLNS